MRLPFFGNHGWENRFGDVYPLDTLKRVSRRLFCKVRVDLCFDEQDGFDVGAFVGTWKRSRGPFMLHRQMGEVESFDYGPWRLMIAFSKDAWDGFDDGAGK